MRIFVLMLSCALLFSALGCGGVQNERAGGYTVTDAEGRTVAFAQKPARVLNYELWLDDIASPLTSPGHSIWTISSIAVTIRTAATITPSDVPSSLA